MLFYVSVESEFESPFRAGSQQVVAITSDCLSFTNNLPSVISCFTISDNVFYRIGTLFVIVSLLGGLCGPYFEIGLGKC